MVRSKKSPEIGRMATVTIGTSISIQGNYLGGVDGDIHMVEVDGKTYIGRLVEPIDNAPISDPELK